MTSPASFHHSGHNISAPSPDRLDTEDGSLLPGSASELSLEGEAKIHYSSPPPGSCEWTPLLQKKPEYTCMGRRGNPPPAAGCPLAYGQGRAPPAGHRRKCVCCLLHLGLSNRVCAQGCSQGPAGRSILLPPHKFLRTAASRAFQPPDVFMCQRCVRYSINLHKLLKRVPRASSWARH